MSKYMAGVLVLIVGMAGSVGAQGGDLCSCHGLPKSRPLLAGADITVNQVTATIETKKNGMQPPVLLFSGGDANLGTFPKKEVKKVEFILMASDPDSDVCEPGIADPYAVLVEKPGCALKVTVHSTFDGVPGTPEVIDLKEKPAGTWTGTWNSPNQPGEYTFTFSGTLQDKYDDHPDSDDPSDLELNPYQSRITLTPYSVELEAQKAGNTPDLEKGRICINAQPEYKKAKWKVVVEPKGTTAKVGAAAPALVTFESIKGSDPNALKDGDEFWAVGGDAVGEYKLTLTHNDDATCTDEGKEWVFNFVSVYNSGSEGPSQGAHYLGAEVVHDDHVGVNAPQNNGIAYMEWTRGHLDDTYATTLMIGDGSLDVNSDIWGWADNTMADPNHPHEGTFWASAADVGKYQIQTFPNPNLYGGHLNWKGTLKYAKDAEHGVWGAVYAAISVGPSFKGIGISLGTEIQLDGDMAACTAASVNWDGNWSERLERYAVKEYIYPPDYHTKFCDYDWEMMVQDDGNPPWETSMGWSVGLLFKSEKSGAYTGYCAVEHGQYLELNDVTFTILK